MRLRLAVLFLQYDNGKYPGAFEMVRKYLEVVDADKKYFVIDNLKEGAYVNQVADNEYLVGGNNADWEFSGWQRGVDVLGELKVECDVILFVNDAFLAYGWSILQNSQLNEIVHGIPGCGGAVGQLDTKGIKMEARGYDVSEWICTNCFFVEPRALKAISNVVSVHYADMGSFIDLEYHELGSPFKADAPLGDSYKKMVIQWLTEDWHSKLKIDGKTWVFYRHKVCAMLNESLLTARFKEAGFKAISYKELIPEKK